VVLEVGTEYDIAVVAREKFLLQAIVADIMVWKRSLPRFLNNQHCFPDDR
jgi:hypothetical protein